MTRKEFADYAISKIIASLPLLKLTRCDGFTISIELSLYGWSAGFEKEDKILPSLKNHFDKLVEDLKNTSNKKLSISGGDKLNPQQQQRVVLRALIAFLEVASKRKGDGIRNAYISFARARKQQYIRSKSEYNDGDGRRGRPNLYKDQNYKHIVNRAVKLKKSKAK